MSLDMRLKADDIKRARQILSELCKGTHNWRMCVPVQADDSDMVLARVIRAAEKFQTASEGGQP